MSERAYLHNVSQVVTKAVVRVTHDSNDDGRRIVSLWLTGQDGMSTAALTLPADKAMEVARLLVLGASTPGDDCQEVAL